MSNLSAEESDMRFDSKLCKLNPGGDARCTALRSTRTYRTSRVKPLARSLAACAVGVERTLVLPAPSSPERQPDAARQGTTRCS